jgi:hypothetical protein
MVKSQMVIPIHQAASTVSACSTGEVTLLSGSCSAASSCASGSSCSSGGGASSDSDDPSVKLAQEGWILRTTIGEPRLSEVVENYRAMGYEVHVENFGVIRSSGSASEDDESCTACYDAADRSNASQAWGSVYVRPGQTALPNEELF